jgi:hypothetical protein
MKILHGKQRNTCCSGAFVKFLDKYAIAEAGFDASATDLPAHNMDSGIQAEHTCCFSVCEHKEKGTEHLLKEYKL